MDLLHFPEEGILDPWLVVICALVQFLPHYVATGGDILLALMLPDVCSRYKIVANKLAFRFEERLTAYNISSPPISPGGDADKQCTPSVHQELEPPISGCSFGISTGDSEEIMASRTPTQDKTHSLINIHACQKKLKPESKQELLQFVKASAAEREIMQYALLLKVAEDPKRGGHGSAEAWEALLHKQIDKFAMHILLLANTASYIGAWPVKVLMHCSDIKEMILQAVDKNKDVIACCQKLPTYGQFKANVNITVQMCAQVAFIRMILELLTNEESFWLQVDQNLQKVCGEHNFPVKVTKWFAGVLEDDRMKCGIGNAERIIQASKDQTNIDTAISAGSFNNINLGVDINKRECH
ncbi:hypothetical protein SERLADRAFT_404801 [Serpula lacrymans var. lacrymans S7.9]|uniref:Uncharacterized protein n=1 Tax=Serpula lacrymans var. lacrymans (strain S7.9) TaxID=578457 RepID=F8NF24_SERL9|nr:uncharacterized protein SERLADRAFT_404801 [Serpula lacrymans var. lacrymans S7.9]EGO30783.1 hypothetical protein SERLADRAFT_404801 [Serpula lacrymans var. lacrymans S7.9]